MAWGDQLQCYRRSGLGRPVMLPSGGTNYVATDGPGGPPLGRTIFMHDSTCSRPQTYKRVWDDKEGKFKLKLVISL